MAVGSCATFHNFRLLYAHHCAGKHDGGKPQPAEGGLGFPLPAPKGRAEEHSLGEAEARLFQLKRILKKTIKYQPESDKNVGLLAQLYTIVRYSRFCRFSMASKSTLKLEFGLKTLYDSSFSDHQLTHKKLSHEPLQFQHSDPPKFYMIQYLDIKVDRMMDIKVDRKWGVLF